MKDPKQQEASEERAVAPAHVRDQLSPDIQTCIPSCGGGGLCSGQQTSFERCLSCGW
jgi:uncharacterized protein (DUF983 family)